MSTTRKSAVDSYRMVWGLWIGLSFAYAAGYWHLAVLSGRLLQGRVLASAFLIQALLVPVYIWREKFSSCAGAAIQSASAAVSVVGLPAVLLVWTETKFRDSDYSHGLHFADVATYGLQFGYVVTILLLSGVAGGVALGILRWRILQAEPVQPNAQPSRSWWTRYLSSAMTWVTSLTIYVWLIDASVWATRGVSSGMSYPYQNASLAAAVLLGIGGLLFIAPMPLFSRAPEPVNRRDRILKYLGLAMRSVAIFVGIVAIPWFLYAAAAFVSYCIVLGAPCLIWAVLYERSRPTRREGTQHSENERSPLHANRRRISNGRVVWIAAVGQACALFAGMLATAPVSLNAHGVGCLAVDQGTGANVYWFWKAYKGLGSEVQTGTRLILRPSVDRSTCLILNQRAMGGMDDPKEIAKGYVGAARIWAWLIDPEQWDGERSKQIRRKMTRLLGRDFSSYDELEAWWKNNGPYLAWSGTDELLEVQQPEDSIGPEPSDNYLRRPYVSVPFMDPKLEVPEFFGPDPFGVSKFPREGYQRTSWDEFRLYDDREARLRGLKLDTASCIDIVTGEQQRRVQEYLHKSIGADFLTYAEWRDFFAQTPRQNPWRVKRSHAEALVARLQQDRSSPDFKEKYQVGLLQGETGLSYSRVDDFMEWLKNPENTRYEAWEKAATVFGSAYDDPERLQRQKNALVWLGMITGQTFDSPEEWMQWWQANRSSLILSADGLKLVSDRK